MRLWTLHPKYLDPKGLVALWREALLAQAVLRGETKGYTNHPQLIRFRHTDNPPALIAAYLQGVYDEAAARGYAFDRDKIPPFGAAGSLPATRGQLEYEWAHLKAKLCVRAPSMSACLESIQCPEPHPLFYVVPGPIAEWERLRSL